MNGTDLGINISENATMNKRSPAKSSFSAKAKEAAARGRSIQAAIDRLEAGKKKSKSSGATQAGQRQYPSRFSPQHLIKPGNEADLKVRPMFEAPAYLGSAKLKDCVAIITGGDSGIGRAVAVLYAREGADVAIAYLDEHEDAETTKRAVEAEGRRCIVMAGDVAIIAMEGRFPGARNLAEFWDNLVAGRESIVPFSDTRVAPPHAAAA